MRPLIFPRQYVIILLALVHYPHYIFSNEVIDAEAWSEWVSPQWSLSHIIGTQTRERVRLHHLDTAGQSAGDRLGLQNTPFHLHMFEI